MVSKIEYEINDSELLYLINENNDDAKDCLFQKYSPLINKELRRFKGQAYSRNIDMTDLTQEAMLAFTYAIHNYKEEADTKFSTFATLCIRRKLINYLSKFVTNKNAALCNAIELDSYLTNTDQPKLNFLSDFSGKEPLNKIITDESLIEISSLFKKNLSEREKKALELDLLGFNIKDIALSMELNQKQIYNLLYRARQKLKID